MRSSICLAIALLTVPAIVGCGGSSTREDATGGTSGSGGSSGTGATGGVATGGGTGGIGSSGGVGGSFGGGGSGGDTSCSGYSDQIPPPNVFTIRLKNNRSSAIYLGGGSDCGPSQLYELQGPSGPVQFVANDNCGNTCQELQQHGPYCTGACMQPLVIRIDPGGHYDESWSGTTYESLNMPKNCYFEPDFAPATCDRQIIAPAGSYAASAGAGTDFTCPNLGTCTCEPNSSGSCELPYGGTPGGESLAAKASFEFPTASMVEIVFQ